MLVRDDHDLPLLYMLVSMIHGHYSGHGLSQRKTTLHCNAVSHRLSPYPDWSLVRTRLSWSLFITNYDYILLINCKRQWSGFPLSVACYIRLVAIRISETGALRECMGLVRALVILTEFLLPLGATMKNTVAWSCRDHFVYVAIQWETALQFNVVAQWLGAHTKLSTSFQ